MGTLVSLVVHFMSFIKDWLSEFLQNRKYLKHIQNIYHSLNKNELIVLWVMDEDGVNVLNACPTNTLIISMVEKKALFHMDEMGSALSLPYRAPKQLMKIVRDNKDTIISVNEQNSKEFMNKIRADVRARTEFRYY